MKLIDINIQDYYVPLLRSGIVIIIFLIVRELLKRTVRNFGKKFQRVEHRTGLIMKHVNFAFLLLVIISLIFIWGVDFKNLGLAMSSVFAVIGIAFFAQWSILSNVTSGIIMFFTFPYKIGDYIIIHDHDVPCEGFIEDIRTFHVILYTSGNTTITYPNSMMLQKGVSIVKNKEHHQPTGEVDKNLQQLPHD
jgi:small-conductance mechanosensitive channel